MIKSHEGQKMISYISPIYDKSKVMQTIFEVIGQEFDDAENLSKDILNQLFPQTSTWGLSYWDYLVGIVTNPNEDISIRRGKIIAELQSRYTITPLKMAMILKNYTGADIEIVENIAPYTFKVKLTGREGFPKSLEDLYKKVKRIKPSHLSVRYELISITESKLYIGATTLCGESITVYPWSPKNIESTGKINIAIGNNTGIDTTTIYPRRED